MSITFACSISILRSLILTLLALMIGDGLSKRLQNVTPSSRKGLWGLLLVPFFSPDLLIGYAYSNFSLSLVHYPMGNELFYAWLILLKVVPLAAVLLYFSPAAPISSEALFTRNLTRHQSSSWFKHQLSLIPFYLRGPVLRFFPAGCLCFLVLFQEFEICSLMNTVSWTLWLFDAKVIKGWGLGDTFRAARYPLAVEFCVISLLIWGVWKWNILSRLSAPRSLRQQSKIQVGFLQIYLILAVLVVFVIPCGLMMRDTVLMEGWKVLSSHPKLWRGIGIAAIYALVTGICSYLSAFWLTRNRQLGWQRKVALLLVSWPGFCGSFLLSLTTLAFFQLRWVHPLYDTLVPLLVSLYLFLLPRAILILSMRNDEALKESVFLGKILESSSDWSQRTEGGDLHWMLEMRRHFWCCLPICFWAYWELTAPSILAPPAFLPAPLRLYNLMHYRQQTGLSALLFATIAAPVLLVSFFYWILRFIHSVRIRFQNTAS